jgi:hypothetical protein
MSNQTVNNTRFTKEAAEWDANKKHVESTQSAFEAIQRYVPAFQNGTSKSKPPYPQLLPVASYERKWHTLEEDANTGGAL